MLSYTERMAFHLDTYRLGNLLLVGCVILSSHGRVQIASTRRLPEGEEAGDRCEEVTFKPSARKETPE
jgi:hypothetical protein